MNKKTIVILAGSSPSSAIVYNWLCQKYNVAAVVMEDTPSAIAAIKRKFNFLKRRARKLGWWTVIGQILFSLLINLPLTLFSKKRVTSIIEQNKLSVRDIPEEKLIRVNSVNDERTIKVLKGNLPDVVVVNGTSIIKEKILNSVDCQFINTHAGITPKYRGVHGMYWALANGDRENAGVTVHFVDKGIDTGNVIYQARTIAQKEDNFSTYFYLQIAEGVKILERAIEGYLNGDLDYDTPPQESHLYYHPTIWRYIYNRCKYGIK